MLPDGSTTNRSVSDVIAQRDLQLSAAIEGFADSLAGHRAAGLLRAVAQQVAAEAVAELRRESIRVTAEKAQGPSR